MNWKLVLSEYHYWRAPENKTVQISYLRAHLHFAESCNKEHTVYHAWKMHKYPSGKRDYSPIKYTFWLDRDLRRVSGSTKNHHSLFYLKEQGVKLKFYLEDKY